MYPRCVALRCAALYRGAGLALLARPKTFGAAKEAACWCDGSVPVDTQQNPQLQKATVKRCVPDLRRFAGMAHGNNTSTGSVRSCCGPLLHSACYTPAGVRLGW